jgi:arabinofuranosyltransferase
VRLELVKRRQAPRPADPPPRASALPTATPAPIWPAAGEWLDPREPFLIPLLLLLAARLVFWTTLPFAAEDAYITFRYAKNLAIGNGLVYNPGEHIMGFSSPLWTVWSAVGYRLFGAPVDWARFWSVAGDAVTVVLLAVLLRRHAGRASAWCFAFFFAAWPFLAAVAVSGMETSAMLTLIVLAAVLVERRSALAGPALAALALIRPEGAAAAVVIALGARWRDRAVAAVLIALGVAALWIYFGSPIPQSALAKASIYGHPGPLKSRFWWDWLVPFPIGGAPTITEGVHLFLLSVVIAPAAVMGVPVVWRFRTSALGLTVGAALTVWLGYVVVGVAFFFWYLVVPLGGVLVLAAAGMPRIARGPAIYASTALFVLGMWSIGMQLYIGRAKLELGTFGAVADYLAEHARPGEKVFLEPIGLIGYRNPLVIVDEVGLVSPAVARRRAEGPGWYTDVVNATRPDWLVVRRGLLTRGAGFAGRWSPLRSTAERDSLSAHYAVAKSMSEDATDQALLVLRRVR